MLLSEIKKMRELMESIDLNERSTISPIEEITSMLREVKSMIETSESDSSIPPAELDQISELVNQFVEWWENV